MVDFGGRFVEIRTAIGTLQLHQPDGQILSGVIRSAPPGPAALPTQAIFDQARAFVERVFPWAVPLDTTGPAEQNLGAIRQYEITWRDTVNGVLMPSWVSITMDQGGKVLSFAANHVTHSSKPNLSVSSGAAIASAQRSLGDGYQLVNVRSFLGRVNGSLHTYWRVALRRSAPTSGTGYIDLTISIVKVDAANGQVLEVSRG